MALGEAPTVGAENQRDVGVSGFRKAEQPRQQNLARRRVREVRAPDHLAYSLRRIIDHHGELVGGRAIVAAHDEIVYRFLETSEQAVLEGYPGVIRAHSQGRRTSGGLAFRALGRCQVAAGSRISVAGGDAVRR